MVKLHSRALSGDFYFAVGTGFFAVDQSYFSRSYCCVPGGGYFKNDVAVEPFDRWGIFENFRIPDPSRQGGDKNWKITDEMIKDFFDNAENWHLLDGYTEGGDPNGAKKPSTYTAYWNMIKNGETSGKIAKSEIFVTIWYH